MEKKSKKEEKRLRKLNKDTGSSPEKPAESEPGAGAA